LQSWDERAGRRSIPSGAAGLQSALLHQAKHEKGAAGGSLRQGGGCTTLERKNPKGASSLSRVNPQLISKGLSQRRKPGSWYPSHRSADWIRGRSRRVNGMRVRPPSETWQPLCESGMLRREESQERCRDETSPARLLGGSKPPRGQPNPEGGTKRVSADPA
jgi:hypothetical protein